MDLSVIIPVYNKQSHIAACLRSVTRCPKETIDMECLVIVNDGSEDETAAIVKRYIERDRRIRLIYRENNRVSDARNRGIEEALGRYIMFLDAGDRLCEDAWEQIEAAVEEEYADFVAFSYITVKGNGRFKAQMLPIADVVSTDEQEARRLMYADSVFGVGWGKLFRSDIVKDQHITFRTDLSIGEEYLFVAEYFGYCKSYLMTKAMIVYHLQRCESAISKCSIDEQFEAICILYEFSKAAAMRCNDSELISCIQVHYVKVLTSLLCEYAKVYRRDKKRLIAVYKEMFENKTVKRILDEADRNAIPSKRKRYEYDLLKEGSVKKISRYFSLKSKL